MYKILMLAGMLGATALGAALGAAPAPRVVTVRARDFSFEAPAEIAAGTVTFRLQNTGKELHHLWVVQLTNGKTPADFTTAMKTWGSELRMPAWAVDVGGPNSAAAGASADGTVTLTAGSYMLVCWVPSSDGMLHVMKGMVKPLTVTQAGASATSEPVADRTLTLDDYSFRFDSALTAGRHTIRIENQAVQSHEVVIGRLHPGHSLNQAMMWMNSGQVGTAPVTSIGGASGLAKGRHMFITADFPPGHYVLLCFIPDVKDGKPHSDHGMLTEFVVQ